MNKKIIYGLIIVIVLGIVLGFIFYSKNNLNNNEISLNTGGVPQHPESELPGNNKPQATEFTLGSFCRGSDENKIIDDPEMPDRKLICIRSEDGESRYWVEAE